MNKLLTTVFALAVASVTAFSTTVRAEEVKGDAQAGEKKIAMCIGCHGIQGYQASFPEVYKVPRIAGQGEKYIVSALTAYRKGDRKHPTMRGIADSLSDQDIADVAAYYSQLGKVEGASLPEQLSREPNAQVAPLLAKGACVSCHGANFAKPI
ncbi:MAG: cytochrome c, partial [Curvibacter sp.]|nr:cytochrome c [Curvibacter sp.]